MGNEALYSLTFPLPEDVEKLKWGGEFEACIRVIDLRLSDARTPEVLRERLLLEREMLLRLPQQYPYSFADALGLLREKIPDFTGEELKRLWEENICDWIYKKGEVFFSDRFLDNLLRTDAKLAARAGLAESGAEERRILHETMQRMREAGGMKLHLHLKTSLSLKEETAERCRGKALRVYMPLPLAYRQVENFRLHALSPKPAAVADVTFPQRTAVFDIDACTGDEVFSTAFSFDNFVSYQQPDPANVSPTQPRFYTEEIAPHIRFTPMLLALTKEVVGDEKNPLLKAWKIYDFITTHVRYSYMRSYSTFGVIPEYVAANLKGDCGFQALTFITMCRAAGVPARWQSGLYAVPGELGAHDWAEYYVAPYGWLFADCSFGGAAFREGDEDRRLFYRCNLDPYRIPYASEFQHDFVLPAPGLRNDPYDNQAGEIFCEGKALLFGEFENKRELTITE